MKKNFDIMGWVAKHQADVTRPPLNKVLAWLKEQGVKEFAAIGYCFGGTLSFLYLWMRS